MKHFNSGISLLFTVFAMALSIQVVQAQSIGTPGGTTNFFNTNFQGGLLGHLQGGSFGGLGISDQWIGIGQPNLLMNPAYGHRIQWGGAFASMSLEDGPSVNKNLEIQWGGQAATSDLDFNFVFDPFSPIGERNVMRLTDLGRVGIGTTNPISKLDIRTEPNDMNLYGVWAVNNRTFGAGAYFQGSIYGSRAGSSNAPSGMSAYGSLNEANRTQPGSSYGAYGFASAPDGDAHGLYGIARSCNGVAFGVYGMTVNFNGCSTNSIQYAGYFNGNVLATGTITSLSDRKLKKNVQDEISALEKIMQLHPATYEYDHEKYPYLNMSKGLNHGFIAQELEEVFPEMVTENKHPIVERIADEEMTVDGETMAYTDKKLGELDFKGVNYQMMIPVLTAAMQEQQALIEELQAQLAALQGQAPNGKGAAGTTTFEEMESNILFQNTPNPFDAETVIRYTAKKTARSITLNIYDMQGREINSFENLAPGAGEVNISGSTLEAGMYIYTLIVDGQEAGTKRMILTKN